MYIYIYVYIYILGIKWLCRGNKLVVAGFQKKSEARKRGIKCGDLLSAVRRGAFVCVCVCVCVIVDNTSISFL